MGAKAKTLDTVDTRHEYGARSNRLIHRMKAHLATSTHVCHTFDGVPIELGMEVKDILSRPAVVVMRPSDWELSDNVCYPRPQHRGHWWGICHDLVGHVHGKGCTGADVVASQITTRDWERI
jgi:hypothetical protein